MQLNIFARKSDWKQNLILEETCHGISFTFVHHRIAFRAIGSVLEPEPIGFKELNICWVP
jgi:hypothetical protein